MAMFDQFVGPHRGDIQLCEPTASEAPICLGFSALRTELQGGRLKPSVDAQHYDADNCDRRPRCIGWSGAEMVSPATRHYQGGQFKVFLYATMVAASSVSAPLPQQSS